MFALCSITHIHFQSVLESLPGVDPQSDAVRQAVGAMSGQAKDSKKKEEILDLIGGKSLVMRLAWPLQMNDVCL